MVPVFEPQPFNLIISNLNSQSPFDFNLPDEKVALLEDFPPSGEVFAVDLGEDGLHRAVYNNDVCIAPHCFILQPVKKVDL